MQTRTVPAVFPNTSANPFFVTDDTYAPTTLYANQSQPYAVLATYTYGSALAFSISGAVGFELYGSDDWTQGLFTVSVSTGGDDAISTLPSASIQYSPRSRWTALAQMKYVAAGLDETQTYQIEVQNLGNTFNLAELVVYEAVTRCAWCLCGKAADTK